MSKNLLTNGGLEIWQRGPGPFLGTGIYTADQWRGSGDVIRVDRNTVNQDAGFAACAKVFSNAVAIENRLIQPLESLAGLIDGPLSFSIRAKCSTPNAVRACISVDGGATWTHGPAHSGSGSFETLTVENVIVPVGSAGVQVGAGSSLSNVTFYLNGAMLTPEAVASICVPLHPAEEWERCERYYEVLGASAARSEVFEWNGASGSSQYFVVPWKTRKAMVPTLSLTGTWEVFNCQQPRLDTPSTDGCVISSVAAGAGVAYFVNPSTGCTIVADASL